MYCCSFPTSIFVIETTTELGTEKWELPGGNSPFAIYMPAGIVIAETEWTNQTPSVVNLTISSNPADDGSTNTSYEVVYEFVDAQDDNDSSTVMWFVNGTYVANTSTFQRI